MDDSIVNAAGRHHRPETFLQWIVATADRVASGFEREEFDKYNDAEDKSRTGRNHYTARQLTLFEQIRLHGDPSNTREDWHFRYPLRPLSPDALFPVKAAGYESNDKAAAQREYGALWKQFLQSLVNIPRSHRENWPLWLDHFDAAWACYTQAIPAATAFNVRPEVSLYDHSRTAASLAAALWRYHHDRGDDPESVRKQLADFRRPDWGEQKLLLIQGDFFGIQDFIFATGGETQRRAAKLLRGGLLLYRPDAGRRTDPGTSCADQDLASSRQGINDMQSLRITLRPLSAFGGVLKGDTLFGQLCWAVRNRYGVERLRQLLDGYTGGNPFAVCSDAFPTGHLPRPVLPLHRFEQPAALDRKSVKRLRWLPRTALSKPLAAWIGIAPGRVTPEEIGCLLDDIGRSGYGRDASIGLGKFVVGDLVEESLPCQQDANACYTLAACSPQRLGLVAASSFYEVFIGGSQSRPYPRSTWARGRTTSRPTT